MKKKFTFLMAAVMLLMMMSLPGKAVGQNKKDVTINFGTTTGYWAAHNSGSYTDGDGRSWSRTYTTTPTNNTSSGQASYSQFGNSSNKCSSLVLTATAGSDMTVTAFSVTMAGASGTTSGTIYLYKRTNGGSETQLATATVSGTSSVTCNITSSVAFSSTDILKVSYAGTAKAIRISSLSYSYTTGGGSSAVATTTTIDDSDITNTDVYVSTEAGSLSATVTPAGGPALDNPAISWESSNTDVATIDSDGAVTLHAKGSTTITASYAGVANEYAASSATYALTVTSSAPDYAELPFTWEGGVSSVLLAQQGVTANGLGSDYAVDNAPYRVKFDGTGDYIQVKTDSQPGKVTIGVKMIGGATTSTITVQGSADGETFTDIEDLTISGAQNATLTLETSNAFATTDRYVRMLFTKGSNVGVGPISISKHVEKYVISLADVSNGTISANKATAAEGETVTLTAAPNTHYGFTAWSVYKTGDPETTITVTEDQFTMPAYPVTVSATFTAMILHTIAFSVSSGGNVSVNATNNQAYCGDVVTITVAASSGYYLTSLTVTGSSSVSISPAVSSAVSVYTFTMPDEDVTIAATFGGEYTVTYSVNGNTATIAPVVVTIGESITLPTPVTLPTGFDFAGWTANASNTSNILTGSYTPTSDITLYAVYSKTVIGPTVSRVVILDGSTLSSVDATSSESIQTVNGFTYKFSDGAKQQSSNGDNRFTNYAILIGKSGKYIYNTKAFGDGITKFEVYANKGASAKVSVGINFSTTTIDSYNASAANTWTQTLSTVDNVYDASSFLPSGAKYFWYQITNANNSQVEFRITYTETPITTSYYTRVFSDETATDNITITGPTIIESGAVLNMGACTITNADPSNLIIEDGGQLICNNSVAATVKKGIDSWNNGARSVSGWNFIASPIAADVDPTTVTNLINATETNYDLYRLNTGTATPGKEWENYKNSAHTDFELVNGMGYLYANADGVDLAFSGAIQPSDDPVEITGLYDGYNLVGNPFTCNATLNISYYTLNATGDAILSESVGGSIPIAPCTGVIIENSSVTFTPTTDAVLSPGKGNVEMVLAQNVTTRGESSSQTLDNAIVSFNEGSQLGKFYFGSQDANLYIPMNNEEYAIVSSSAQGEMPVNFKAHRDGQYTITVNPQEVEMGYLHLIDNVGGKDIDLLATPSYTFNAKADDYESRFRLVFSANMVNADLDDDFAFFSNGQLVIANEGESLLQVIDVNGRIVMTESVNGTCSKAINVKAGVYVLRLIQGTDVKTQKIIVK